MLRQERSPGVWNLSSKTEDLSPCGKYIIRATAMGHGPDDQRRTQIFYQFPRNFLTHDTRLFRKPVKVYLMIGEIGFHGGAVREAVKRGNFSFC